MQNTDGVSAQAPPAVLLIRPHHFAPNPATAIDNAFQSLDPTRDSEQIAADAYAEVTGVATARIDAGVRVHVFENESATHPDSVFPNNWFSTHAGGYVATYPMHSESRRIERRSDIVEMLKRDYRVQEVTDYSGMEYNGIFLEGTGVMVLDHMSRLLFAARSNRANSMALERFCTRYGYESLVFEAVDSMCCARMPTRPSRGTASNASSQAEARRGTAALSCLGLSGWVHRMRYAWFHEVRSV